MELDVLDGISEEEFASQYIKKNRPAVIKNIDFDSAKWEPNFLKGLIGDLPTQEYDSLFDLQNLSTLSHYIDTYFGKKGPFEANVPYVRWYNQLKDVDYAWGDKAFSRVSPFWKKPNFLSGKNLLIPVASEGDYPDPTTDQFPYRGILVAARGARTRLHTDPFCSDAVVSQFYGVKSVAMYHPDRAKELSLINKADNSFGGYVDVRGDNLDELSHEPDFHGTLGPGELLYVPHGWLHDVIVLEDSVSITWNFIHEKGALEYIDYLMDDPSNDSEFEVLKYFYMKGGDTFEDASEIIRKYNKYFSQIELACE
ncbi:cupin-like domain-containing protein [Pseudoalteromonas rhizosphaerae]|uniref:cupin-like domain-containing protein n=1 Tax=Pseudoalteromonas rhizosphaerae TaxID=2518973 RepID=UPI002148F7BE|nr:cupin-like domain-containing protein [Pseudoalteromonas rhizosphaerae]